MTVYGRAVKASRVHFTRKSKVLSFTPFSLSGFPLVPRKLSYVRRMQGFSRVLCEVCVLKIHSPQVLRSVDFAREEFLVQRVKI